MDIEKCHDCGVEKYIKLDATEESQRIPFGTVREIAARIPYLSSEHIEKYEKNVLSEAIEKGLW